MKQKNPEIKPIDYNKLNKISGINFVPKKEKSKFFITSSVSNKKSKLVSKPAVVSKSLSNMEQMSSNNPFNTSDARRFLDDVKARIGELQEIVKTKTNIRTNIRFSSFDDEIKKVFETQIAIPLNNISARVIHFEQAFLKETSDFVKDHKSLVKQAK